MAASSDGDVKRQIYVYVATEPIVARVVDSDADDIDTDVKICRGPSS